MIIVPNEKIRKYVAYSPEEKKWIHDPNMPAEYENDFQQFCDLAAKYNHLEQD